MPPEDPSFYVQNACVTDPSLAPPGHSTLYVLVPVGNLAGGIDWRARGAPLSRARPAPAGSDRDRGPRAAHPLREDRHAGRLGARHADLPRRHVQPRPQPGPDAAPPAAQPVRGSRRVYLVGGGTHPGSGLPVIFESARITSRLLAQDLGLALPCRCGATGLSPRSTREGFVMARDLPIGVIGGGLGGLAAACTLAARGHEVILFEKNAWLGGKAAVLEERGFRFDMGPTILTVPRVLARIFAEAGRRLEDDLDLVRLDPQWRCFFADGSRSTCAKTSTRWRPELETFAPAVASPQGYAAFLQVSQRLHDISERFFFWKPVEGLRDMIDLRRNLSAATLGDVLSLRMGATVAGTVRRKCPTPASPRCSTTSPSTSARRPTARPAVLCGIAHMQVGDGVWYPGRHPRRARGAARLAEELGVEIRTGADVRRLLIERRPGAGARDGGWRAHRARRRRLQHGLRCAPTANSSAARLRASFARGRRHEPACSGVVLYLGFDRGYDHLLHHNFVFSRDPEEEFDSIYHAASPPRTRPAISPPRPAPSPVWRRPAAKRSTSSSTRPTCGRTTTGTRCCPATDG